MNMIFLTQHKLDNRWTENIEANNWDEAEKLCPKDETIIGELIKTIYISDN